MISVLLAFLLESDASFLSVEFLVANLHLIIYTLLIAAIIYLVFQQSYKPSATTPVVLTPSVRPPFRPAGLAVL